MRIDEGTGSTHLRVRVGVGGHIETRRSCDGDLWVRMRQVYDLNSVSGALARIAWFNVAV